MVHDIALTPAQVAALAAWAETDNAFADVLISRLAVGTLLVGQGDSRARIHSDGSVEEEA